MHNYGNNAVFTALAPLVRRSEGLRLHAYRDTGGVLTIGYGHTKNVQEGMCIGADMAEELLMLDMQDALVHSLVICPVLATMPPACVAAVSDFTFNLGATQLRASTLRRRINAKEFDDVPYQLRRWIYDDGIKLPGLIIRREAEVAMWKEGYHEYLLATTAQEK